MCAQIRQGGRFAVALMCIVLLASCTTMGGTRFLSNVDSLAHADALAKKRYILMSGNKDVPAGDLQFIEYAGYIEKVLTGNGFVKAASIADADVVIFLSYGIGNPQTHQYSYSLPVWGQTGVSSSNTYGTLSTYGNMGTYSGTTTYTPTYGVKGYTSHVGSYTTFTRFLLMDAYDVATYKKDQKLNEVWKTTVVSVGSGGDLRVVFPYMAAAMKPYVGTNTGKQVEVQLYEDDPEVMQLRGNVDAPQGKK